MNAARSIATLSTLLVCGVTLLAQQEGEQEGDAAKPGKWEDEARAAGLAPEDIARLRADKVLVTNDAYKQVFDPYIKSNVPPFITSDSLLNAFHVLYEESVLRLEEANAGRLPALLEHLWSRLPSSAETFKADADLRARALRRAQVMIGTALTLARGEAPVAENETVAALIKAEAARITAAAGLHKPEWLGMPDDGFTALDYSRYRPRGFYMRSKILQRYSRAISWLQSVPFRVERDEELLAILILGRALTGDAPGRRLDAAPSHEAVFRAYTQFIGTGDDWDLLTAARFAADLQREAQGDLDLAAVRTRLLDRAGQSGYGPQINDQVRFAPLDALKTAEVNFRIVSAYRTPDAVLFHRTTDLRRFSRGLPTGLEVAAALGSSYARDRVTGRERPELLKTIDQSKRLFRGGTLYMDYLHCLEALLDEPEPDAPAFMNSEPWRIKSCQTVLAGWAQLRHTWALQAKQSVTYLGLTIKPSGFIEPEPEFFARVSDLVERTEERLSEAGAFETNNGPLVGDPVKNRRLVRDLREAAALLEAKGFGRKGREALEDLTDEEQDEHFRIHAILFWLERTGRDRPDFGTAAYYADLIARLDEVADRAEKGDLPDDPRLARALEAMRTDVRPLWRRLAGICRKLEALANKQLRGVPFNRMEAAYIEGYGELLAGVMLYGGNSYLKPRDDAPRIADVHYDPNTRQCLLVGIARPRALWVLYPVKGQEVLSRGAVLPYYEFAHSERLTDAEWQRMLDSKERPDVPEWVRPIVGSGGIGVPKLERE